MPAKPPPPTDRAAARLKALGEGVRAHRRRLGLSAATVAEAAGLSRVTLHRLERGEPSVTVGAWAGVLDALGLDLSLNDRRAEAVRPVEPLPAEIELERYPQLRRLAWQLDGPTVAPAEALDLYERNWRHVEQESLEPQERDLIERLGRHLRGGRPLV